VEAETTCLGYGKCGFIVGDELLREWDLSLIFLSWMVSVVGSSTALRVVAHIRRCSDPRWYWALVMMAGVSFGGLAVWSMHQTGMHALTLKARAVDGRLEAVHIEYTLSLTLGSIFASSVLGGLGVWILTARRIERRKNLDKEFFCRLLISAGVVAGGICAMHYMGMLSVHGPVKMTWHPGVLLLSFVIAFAVSALGLGMLLLFPEQAMMHALAATLMACGVCSMHYTGMYAATYTLQKRDTSITGENGLNISGLSVVICGLMVNLVVSIPVQYYSERQRRAHAKDLEQCVDISTRVADALVNYDLERASLIFGTSTGKENKTLMPLHLLLRNLAIYRAFLPNALFDKTRSCVAECPNDLLAKELNFAVVSPFDIDTIISRLRDPSYTIPEFAKNVIAAFPELRLYNLEDCGMMSSGHTATEEYQRTMGALYTVFALMRLDIDGKNLISFGIDAHGHARTRPEDDDVTGDKKLRFLNTMEWNRLMDLMMRAGIFVCDYDGSIVDVQQERALAMITLTVIHDIMKNTLLLPEVQARHAPFLGQYPEGDIITDHDQALAYILEHYPTLLPSYHFLTPGQRAPVLFTQAKMNFNNGWLVQGEAPPGAVFREFKAAITQGRAQESDVSFYFVHWLTDLAGAHPFGERPWPGAEKLTVQLPMHVLTAFLKSFKFVERLAHSGEVKVMEDYLNSRVQELQLVIPRDLINSRIACARLALMAQGFEADIISQMESLCADDREVLTHEMALTACKEAFDAAPTTAKPKQQGPAILVYYAPALLQKAGKQHAAAGLSVLAAVFRAARVIFPFNVAHFEHTCVVRIDAMKALTPPDIQKNMPWVLKWVSGTAAEAVCGPAAMLERSLPVNDMAKSTPMKTVREIVGAQSAELHIAPFTMLAL